MTNPTSKWEDDALQFSRLLCEINATQELDFEALADAMDLAVEDVESLFDRANDAWESAKEAQ